MVFSFCCVGCLGAFFAADWRVHLDSPSGFEGASSAVASRPSGTATKHPSPKAAATAPATAPKPMDPMAPEATVTVAAPAPLGAATLAAQAAAAVPKLPVLPAAAPTISPHSMLQGPIYLYRFKYVGV